MRSSPWFLLICGCLFVPASAQSSLRFKQPIPAAQMTAPLRPGHDRPDLRQALHNPAERRRFRAAMDSGTLQTLPYWQGSFTIGPTSYNYTILGGNPQNSGNTKIKTVLVPLSITVSDYSLDGQNALVFDATPVMAEVIGSPIFQVSNYLTGYQQFGDAMLRAEFPTAPANWHTILTPVIAATVNITIAAGGAQVFQATNGTLFANILDDSAIDDAILNLLHAGQFTPDEYPIFISYNSSEHDALGYHAAIFQENQTQENVFAYTSWLDGLDTLFAPLPSPDAATLSHEVAETLHDAFNGDLESLTLEWGDAFNHNKCFQSFIEVGDAVEDAAAHTQLHQQVVGFGSQAHVYTLQTEAMLPWFERKTPSDALAGAYSFPDIWVLKQAAPYNCVP
jgi:hypothetical protein